MKSVRVLFKEFRGALVGSRFLLGCCFCRVLWLSLQCAETALRENNFDQGRAWNFRALPDCTVRSPEMSSRLLFGSCSPSNLFVISRHSNSTLQQMRARHCKALVGRGAGVLYSTSACQL